jgi:hypothetical protein
MTMTNRGLLRILEPVTPYARLSSEMIPDGVMSTVVRVMTPVPWSNVAIMLQDDANFVRWYPSTGELDNGANPTANLGNLDIGSINVSCTAVDRTAVDLLGNGMLDEGDYFILNTWLGTSFAPSQNCTVAVVYEPVGELICRSVFDG